MGLFGGNKSGITDADRLRVLDLVTDEDVTLYEVAEKFDNVGNAQRAVAELLKKNFVDMSVMQTDRRQAKISTAEAEALIGSREAWKKFVEGEPKYLIMATDHGWRWHQKHWKPGS